MVDSQVVAMNGGDGSDSLCGSRALWIVVSLVMLTFKDVGATIGLARAHLTIEPATVNHASLDLLSSGAI